METEHVVAVAQGKGKTQSLIKEETTALVC